MFCTNLLLQEYKLPTPIEEGDVLGFSYDHVELNIYNNGKNMNTPIIGIKGTVFPVLFGESLDGRKPFKKYYIAVDEGAILDAVFENFYHSFYIEL